MEKAIPAFDPPASTADSARVARFTPHRIDVDVRASGEGILTLSEPFFPGWKALVEGRPRELLRVNYILRGVQVGPEDREVVFRYEPTSYRLGLFLSCLGVGVLAGGLGAFTRSRIFRL